jgi:hypothetical protein
MEGDAKMMQSGSDTYNSLWETLTKRYEIKRIIVEKHIDKICNIKPIQRESSNERRSLTA